MNRTISIFIALALIATSAYAQKTITMAYSRANISIIRKSLPAVQLLPWQSKTDIPPENPAVSFDVEVRDANSMYNQKGWFNMSDLAPGNGILLTFTTPKIAPVTHSTQYTAYDILLADSEGKIIQIIPNIRLSELDKDIVPQAPVLAFLFLKGGTCASKSINPGDMIEYSIFKKSPVVVNALPIQK